MLPVQPRRPDILAVQLLAPDAIYGNADLATGWQDLGMWLVSLLS